MTPYKSHAKVWFELEKEGKGTRVTWFMDSSLPFFMFWMKKMMTALLGMDYQRGLELLKDYAEDGEVHSKMNFDGAGTYQGCKYIGVRSTASIAGIGPAMEKDFEKIWAYLDKNKDIVSGKGISIYHKWELVKGKCDYTAGVPVSEIPSDLPEGLISGEIPSTPISKITHQGPYRHLGNAWSTMQYLQRNKAFKMNKKIHPFENYVNMPGEVQENELCTEIIFAAK